MLTAGQASDLTLATFVLRTSVPPLSLLDAVRLTEAELRPDIPVAFAETMDASLAQEMAAFRLSSLLVMLAAAVTLILSLLGVYGVLAYVVGLPRPEFGVRLAMGASGAQLRRMVLVQGMITAGLGVVAGAGRCGRRIPPAAFAPVRRRTHRSHDVRNRRGDPPRRRGRGDVSAGQTRCPGAASRGTQGELIRRPIRFIRNRKRSRR